MNLPTVPPNYASLGAIAGYLRALATSIATGWNIEHRANGRHALPWVDVPFDAASFSASSGTWTVDAADVLTFKYWVIDHTMTVSFVLNTTSVSATPSFLSILIPGDRIVVGKYFVTTCRALDNGTERLGLLQAAAGTRFLQILPVSYATAAVVTWAASANTTTVQGQITFEVQ